MLIKECNKSTTVKNQTLLYQGLVYDKIAVFLCAAAFNIYKEVVVNGDEIIPSEYLINFTDKVLSRADEMLWEKVELNNVN
jgi:hypothetical protein